MDDNLNKSIVVVMQNISTQDTPCFLTVCVEAGSISEGLRLIATAKPHIAIVDMAIERHSRIELIRNIKAVSPKAAVMVLSLQDKLLSSQGLLPAGERREVEEIKAAKNGLHAARVSKKIAITRASKVVEGNFPSTDSEVEHLSSREFEVFRLLGCGCSTTQIAEEMQVSFKTVHSFRGRIKEKLKLSSATHVLREALRWHDRQNLAHAAQSN
jgi:DNA-binding NarL/FixJ family response regulator